MKRRAAFGSRFGSVLPLLALAVVARGANLTWDANTTTAGAQGGDGTWNTTNTNWFDGVANTNWVNANPDGATFGGTVGGTVSLGVAISAGNITFATNYLIRSNTLTLVGTPTISVANNSAPTINSTLTGSGLVKTNGGTLTLGGANTFTGGTTLAAGLIVVNANTALGSGPLTYASSGVRLVLTNGVTVANAITIGANAGAVGGGLVQPAANSTGTLTGPITINNSPAGGGHFAAATGALLVVNSAITSSVPVSWRAGTGVFGGGGAYPNFTFTDTIRLGANNGLSTQALLNMAASGPGVLDLRGFNQTFAGMTNVNAATVINGGGAATLTIDTPSNYPFSGTINGPVTFVKNGSGVQILSSGNSSFTGAVTVLGGELRASTAAATTNSAFGLRTGLRTITVNTGATVNLTANNVFGGSAQTAAGVQNIALDGGTLNASRYNVIGNLTLQNGASLTQTTTDTGAYEGYQFIGTVAVSGTSPSTITTGNAKGNHLRGAATTAFTVADVTGDSSADLIVSAPLRNGSSDYAGVGSFSKAGPGTMRLDSSNTLTGTAFVQAGTLALDAGGSLSNATVDVGAGAVFDVSAVSGFTVPTSMTILGIGTVNGSLTAGAGTRILPGGDGAPGTLTLANDVSLGAGYTNAFDLTNTTSVGGGTNDLLVVGGFLSPAGSPVLIKTLAPLASGSYRLIQYGTADLASGFGPVLGNTFRDTWTLNTNTEGVINLDVVSGTPQQIRWLPDVSNGDWDFATSNWVDVATGTVTDRFYDLDTVLFDEQGAYSNTVNFATIVRPTAVVVDGASNYVFSGTGRISNPPATVATLTKSGSGTLVLAQDHDFTGGTVVSNGTLQIGTGGSTGLVGTGPIRTMAPGVTLFFRSNGAITVANVLSGDGTVAFGGTTVTGESSYAPSAVNTGFVGTLVVSNGARLALDNANDIGNAALIQVSDGGGLYQSAGTFGRPVQIAGQGWLEGSGRLGALRVENNNWTGSVTLTANARVGAYNANGTVSGAISGPYELEIWAGPTVRSVTLSPPVPNTYGSLRVSSNGIASAGNANAFSLGPVVMNGGTQRLNGFSFAFSNLSSTALGGNIQNSHASQTSTFTVGLDDSSTAYGGVFANGNAGLLAVTKVGAGVLTLTGSNLNTGAFTIQGGTLALGSSGHIASSGRVVLAGGTFDTTARGQYAPLHQVAGEGTVSGDFAVVTAGSVQPGTAGRAGTLTFAQNLGLASTYTTTFDLTNNTTAGGGANDLLAVLGNLEPSNSTIAVNYGVPMINGTYTLVTYGTKSSSFNPTVAGNNSRKTWVLDESTPNQVNLIVSGGGNLSLAWNAQTSTNWDAGAGANWLDLAGLTNTTYLDGDTVLFDDNGAVSNAVNLVGVLKPVLVTVNSASNYSLTGNGRISGPTSLNKDGAGTLTLGGAAHDFFGPIAVSGGVLRAVPANVLPAANDILVAPGATLNLDAAATSYTNLNAISGSGNVLLTFAAGANNNVYLQGVSTGFTGTIELTALGVTGNKLNSTGLNVAASAPIKVNDGAQLFFVGANLPNPVSIVGTGNSENRGAIRLTPYVAGITNFLTGPLTLLGNASLGLEGAGILGDITNGVATPSVLTLGTANSGGVGLFGGTIADGAGVLTVVVSNGTPTFTGTNTYTGGTVLRGGTLVVDTLSDTGVSRIANTGTLTFNGGTLRYTGAGFEQTARTVTNAGGASLDVTNPTATVLFSGAFGGPGTFTKAGPGTMVLSNVDYFTTAAYVNRRGTLIFDGGSYTSTAAGTGDLIGNNAGESALLILTNGVQYYKNENFACGWAVGSTGVVAMYSGRLRANNIRMGNAVGASSVFYQYGGEAYAAGEIDAGYNASTYGFIQLDGGSMSNSSWQQASRFGVGLMYLFGGTNSILTSGNGFIAGNNNGTGVFYFAGSAINNAGRIGVGWSGTSRGEVNIANGSVVPAQTTGVLFNQTAGGAAVGILNLNNGTVVAPAMFRQVAGGYSAANFDQGTFQASAASTIIGNGVAAGALDAVYVRNGGANFDTTNFTITVNQALLAPTGGGVTALPSVPANSGFIGAPYVAIRGGGGTGATAVALMDVAGGSVTSLVLTSPGVGYSSQPTVTLVGGGPVSNLVVGNASIGAQGSGGLTKLGTGQLFLNAVNTYTGLTAVQAGTLFGTGLVAGSVSVADAAVLGPKVLVSPTGTLAIAGSVSLAAGGELHAFLQGTNPSLVVLGDIASSASNPVHVIRTSPVTAGTYTLVDYNGTFTGDTNNLALVAIPNGGQGYLQVDTVDTKVLLVVTNAGTGVKWSGATDADWKLSGAVNWLTQSAGTPTTYSLLDDVLFDDSAVGNFAVNLAEVIQPNSLVVNNASSNYTFSGSAIVGAQALVKSGAARLTLASTNGYTGGTVLNAGALRLASVGALGAAGQTITANGGAIEFGVDTAVNAYNLTLASSLTTVLDRATSGTGIASPVNNLTFASDATLAASVGGNVAAGRSTLSIGGTWTVAGRTMTFDAGPSAVIALTGALPGNAQTATVRKTGSGRLVLGGNYGTWDAGGNIALNEGVLEVRSVLGDAAINRTINASNGTTLAFATNASTLFYSALNVLGSMTVLSERIVPGNAVTQSFGSVVFAANGATLTAGAGDNVTAGSAGLLVNTIALGTGSVISVVNSTTGLTATLIATGLVSGAGQTLVKDGDGTLLLRPSMPENYTGGTIVNGGTLILGFSNGGLNFGTIAGALTINSGATARVTVDKGLGLAGAASGNVSVITINYGLLEQTGPNGMNGGQTVYMTGGEIRSNNGNPATNTGCFRFTISGTNAPVVFTLASAATSTISGRIALDSAGRFDVQDGPAGVDLNILASLTDGINTSSAPGTLVKTNAGTMALNAPSYYTGVSTVDGGTLLVNNGTGSATGTNALTVASGATLGGTGVVAGTVNLNGTVAPGTGVGRLIVGGNLAMLSTGATFAVELGGLVPGVEHDQLVVSNSAVVNGTLAVSLVNAHTAAVGNVYTVLVASAGGGSFSTLDLPNLGTGFGWDVTYPSGSVVLTVTGAPPVLLSGYDLAATTITNGLSGYGDDADGDGYANLLEYATGGSLTNADTTARMNAGRTNGVLALKFFRDTAATDATIIVEGSYTATNGAAWLGIATNLAGSWGAATNVTESGASPVSVTVQDTEAGATNRFLRLHVTRP